MSVFKNVDGAQIEMAPEEIAQQIADAPSPIPAVTVIDKIGLYSRMTDDEYTAMLTGVATQSKRVQDIYNRADTFRSDAALWPLLNAMAVQLYGPARAAELLTS